MCHATSNPAQAASSTSSRIASSRCRSRLASPSSTRETRAHAWCATSTPSCRVRSSSPTEDPAIRLEPGTMVAGFRLERELGRGARAVVWQATQPNLDRNVALKLLLRDDQGPLAWPEHPRVVSMYATGAWEGGRFVAMQLVRGRSLSALQEAGELDPRASLELLADVASGLDAAHRAGIVHGDVTARNVFVDDDGRALLSDFGLAARDATIAADRAGFAALVHRGLGESQAPLPDHSSATDLVNAARAVLPGPARRRRRGALLGAGVCAIAAAAVLVTLFGGSGVADAPAVEPGARALGSELASNGVTSVDCEGRRPSGGSQACTLVQAQLPGRPLTPAKPGVIHRWVVRGARGELALQVVRRRGARYESIARSRFQL